MSQIRPKSLMIAALTAIVLNSSCLAGEPQLQGRIEGVLSTQRLSGVAWALVGENGESTLGAAGFRDYPSRTEFTIGTRFHVGSLTKSLIATGVLRLVTQGAIELDAPIASYLPTLSFDNPWDERSSPTVRHLLDHTSGLEDARLWQIFSERPSPNTPLVNAFPTSQGLLRIRSRPGARFSYSNMGYALLGLLVESVTGNSYEIYLDEHVLVPLAMHNSTFAFTTQAGDYADPTLAWGHVDDGSRYAARPGFLRPAGQFTTTAGDLSRFAQFLLSDGVLDGKVFIEESLMRSRGHAWGTEAANNGLVAGYALGLGRRDRHRVIGYCHGGNIVGFVSMLCIYPHERKAFAYSVNTDSESADYSLIDSLLIDALAVAGAPQPRTQEPDADVGQWRGRYILSPNRFQTFRYLDTVFGAINVLGDENVFTMAFFQKRSRQLRPLGGRLFSADDRATSSHVFLRGEGGQYLISDGFKTFEKVPTAYLAAHWVSILLGLAGLIWLFVAGLISLVRYRARALRRAEAPAFIAVVFLFAP